MKALRKSYWIMFAAAALVAGCAAGPQQGASVDAAQRVLDAYDVPDLLAQAGPVVSESLSNNLPGEVDTQTRERLRMIIADVYEPQKLTADVVARLQARAEQAGREAALAEAAEALASPLAARMIGLESVAGNDGFADGFNAFIRQPVDERRKARLRTVNTISQNMSVVELQTSFNLTLLEAMVRARNAATGAEYQVTEQEIQRMLGNTRQGIRSRLREQVPLMLLYVFRNVEDSVLDSYAELQSRPALVWTNQALTEAIQGALEAAGEKIPERLNTAA